MIERPLRLGPLVLLAFLLAAVSAAGQTTKTDSTRFQLGEKVVVIPAPAGFEEAASQFENIKTGMSVSEDPGNEMLAVHLPTADCEKLRRGEFGPMSFYTKISIRKARKETDISAAEFAALPDEFRKGFTTVFDMKSDGMKSAVERLEKNINEMNQGKANVEVTQPVNLGEFDNRPNVYSDMLMMTLKLESGGKQRVIPFVAGISFVRVKQRLLFVYTYRRYESPSDIESLRDFTKQWVTSILAAN